MNFEQFLMMCGLKGKDTTTYVLYRYNDKNNNHISVCRLVVKDSIQDVEIIFRKTTNDKKTVYGLINADILFNDSNTPEIFIKNAKVRQLEEYVL